MESKINKHWLSRVWEWVVGITENQLALVQQWEGMMVLMGVSFMRIRMFRTTAEAKGEDFYPVKDV